MATNRVEILDLDPFHTWVKGRVAVLGDAAHNTTPDIGQGGCSAMEDAVALQWAFRDHPGDVHAALVAYQQARSERAADLVLRARKRCDVTHGKDPGRPPSGMRSYDTRTAATSFAESSATSWVDP